MSKNLTLASDRVLRAPYIETRNAGSPQAYKVLMDAPLWVECVRIWQGIRREDRLMIEAGNPYHRSGEECFVIVTPPELPPIMKGSALYRANQETGRLELISDDHDSGD